MSGVNIGISEDLVLPIIEQRINAAVVAALGKEQDLIENVVSAALSQKVSSSGRVSDYSGANRYTFLEAFCRNAIQEAARQAMQEWITENKPQLVAAMKKQITASPSKLVKAFTDGIADSAKSAWAFQVNVSPRDSG